MSKITVHKLNHKGEYLWHYEGIVIYRDEHTIQLEAFFNRDDVVTPYHTFRRGDRIVEWFYNNRWYNVFQIHDVNDDRIKGWYCNITRPARFEGDLIYADDLALDVMVYPDGRYLILDEDEFEALDLDAESRQQALAAVEVLKGMIEQRGGVFAAIQK